MDFGRILNTSLIVLSIGSAWLACAQLAHAGDAREPSEFAWFKSDNDIVEGFAQRYTECVGGQSSFVLQLGRLAFNSPRLLGGQAARMQLSCASCHPSGRANERFFIAQISSAPGTADISHHFLSSAGGDDEFNPKLIPDLANRNSPRNRDRLADDFALFMHRLIEVEFDGRKPPRTVFNALLSYLQNTDKAYCDNSKAATGLTQRETLLQEAFTVLRAMIGSSAGDDELRFAIASARSQLETLYEAYGLAPVAQLDDSLIKLSRGLDDILKKESAKSRSKQLAKVASEVLPLLALLHKHEASSAFNTGALEAYLKARVKQSGDK